MRIISDLQLHSRYSRAVSQQMVIPLIWEWAKRKGIGLMATGDWTHPLWMREIKTNLIEDGSGLLKLKSQISNVKTKSDLVKTEEVKINNKWSESDELNTANPLFLLATEVSSIYSQGGKLRRIHNLIWAPSIATAEKINKELIGRGANLISDGRPIIGLTSIQVAELVFSIDPKCLLIPAHAWTPWFSLYGSESGFDSIDECFGSYAKYIYAIETGLSSNPAMNWRIKELDNRSIVSFSDAHSGPKIGREATVFELAELSYEAIREAIIMGECHSEQSEESLAPACRQAGMRESSGTSSEILRLMPQDDRKNTIAYTIEFYPEEGKYHYTGHRNCGVKQSPEETKQKGTTCSVCGRKLTVGVMHRVEQLAGRTEEELQLSAISYQLSEKSVSIKMRKSNTFPKRSPYIMLVPLQEILAEAVGGLPTSQNVQNEYKKLTDHFGGEFEVLLGIDTVNITKISGPKVAEAISRVRNGDIVVDPGFDGVFGKVKIWNEEKEQGGEKPKEQLSLF